MPGPNASRTLAASLAIAVALSACGGERLSTTAAAPPHNVVLITIDTLRADTLGFMGHRGVTTPTMDRLAAQGRFFTFAHAHNVVTLPSHANILTGRYPYEHGIRDNGGFRLPDDVPTLATRLKEAGFATGAVVAAYPLAARFGLARGFDFYDESFDEPVVGDFLFSERRGDEVVERALGWWRRNAGSKRFLWLHLFDPHAPYEAPAEFAAKHPNEPYLAEVEATDSFLAPLLDPFLQGLEPPTLIALTSDHGEALGDHDEETHGVFAYEATLKVPLVIWGPGVTPGADGRSARHVDIAATILEALGLAEGVATSGRSLLADEEAAAEPPSYFESLSPNLGMSWAPLRGMIAGGGSHDKAIELPLPELYDLAADPAEANNLYPETSRRARPLLAALPEESKWPPEAGELDEEERRRLGALGYLTSRGSADRARAYTEDDDPKRLIGLRTGLNAAVDAFRNGRLEEAIAGVERILAVRPETPLAYSYLSSFHLASGRTAEALRTMRLAVERSQAQPDLVRQFGLTLVTVGRADEALRVLAPLAANSPDVATLNNLALARAATGRADEALATLERALALDSGDPRTHENLSFIHLEAGRFEEARKAAETALTFSADRADTWNNLGVALFNLERYGEARRAFERVVALRPRRLDSLFQLGLAAFEAGEYALAKPVLERFLANAPAEALGPQRQAAAQALQEMSS